MKLDLSELLALAGDSIRDPREGVRRLLSLGLTNEARWMALGVVVAASVILTEVALNFMPFGRELFLGGVTTSPLITAGVMAVMMVALSGVAYLVARSFGGVGSFSDTLLVMVWIQFIMTCVQAIQLVVMMVFPLVSSIVGLLGGALFIYILTQFIKELHGFSSALRVLGMIVVTMVALVFTLSFIAAALQLAAPVGVPGNV